jgi:hypothetical protein
MTDFLLRLAQRTLGLTPVVQPRIASRYGPVDTMMGANDHISNIAPDLEPTSGAVTTLEGSQGAQPISNAPLSPVKSSNQTLSYSNWFLVPSSPSSLDVNQYDSPLLPSTSQPPSSSPINSVESLVKNIQIAPQQSLLNQAVIPTREEVETQQLLRPSFHVGQPSASPLLPSSIEAFGQTPQVHPVHLPLISPTIENLPSPPWNNDQKASIAEKSGLSSPSITVGDMAAATYNGVEMSQNAEETVDRLEPVQGRLSDQSSTIPPVFTSTHRLSASITRPIRELEPAIEVRIGRIEVRGMPPVLPKQQTRSIPSTPALSLSDYLNQRDGGRT